MSTPTGPAGGDLGGTYPDPIVVGLSHVAAGGDLGGMMDAPIVANLSHVASGGDLGGTMEAPTVLSLAHASVGPAVYPAGDGSLLTNLPPPQRLFSGAGQNLDGGGNLTVVTSAATASLVACKVTPAGWLGELGVTNNGGGSFTVFSTSGAADGGLPVNWIAF